MSTEQEITRAIESIFGFASNAAFAVEGPVGVFLSTGFQIIGYLLGLSDHNDSIGKLVASISEKLSEINVTLNGLSLDIKNLQDANLNHYYDHILACQNYLTIYVKTLANFDKRDEKNIYHYLTDTSQGAIYQLGKFTDPQGELYTAIVSLTQGTERDLMLFNYNDINQKKYNSEIDYVRAKSRLSILLLGISVYATSQLYLFRAKAMVASYEEKDSPVSSLIVQFKETLDAWKKSIINLDVVYPRPYLLGHKITEDISTLANDVNQIKPVIQETTINNIGLPGQIIARRLNSIQLYTTKKEPTPRDELKHEFNFAYYHNAFFNREEPLSKDSVNLKKRYYLAPVSEMEIKDVTELRYGRYVSNQMFGTQSFLVSDSEEENSFVQRINKTSLPNKNFNHLDNLQIYGAWGKAIYFPNVFHYSTFRDEAASDPEACTNSRFINIAFADTADSNSQMMVLELTLESYYSYILKLFSLFNLNKYTSIQEYISKAIEFEFPNYQPIINQWTDTIAMLENETPPPNPSYAPVIKAWSDQEPAVNSYWNKDKALVRYGVSFVNSAAQSQVYWGDWVEVNKRMNPTLADFATSPTKDCKIRIFRQFKILENKNEISKTFFIAQLSLPYTDTYKDEIPAIDKSSPTKMNLKLFDSYEISERSNTGTTKNNDSTNTDTSNLTMSM